MYNKKAAKSLKLSVSGMGVLIFEGLKPLDTIRFSEMKSWTYSRRYGGRPQRDVAYLPQPKALKKDQRGPCAYSLSFRVMPDTN